MVVASGLQSTGSKFVSYGLSCSSAGGIFPDQGSNRCLLHWQADSLPLSHQEGPFGFVLICICFWLCQILVAVCGILHTACWHAGSVGAVHRLGCPPAWGVLVPRPGMEPHLLCYKVHYFQASFLFFFLLFLVALGLRCCMKATLFAVHRFLMVMASRASEHKL